MASGPTPATPILTNRDGSVSVLVYQGRTWNLSVTHKGLLDPTGYSCAIAFKSAYDAETVLASGSTDDGAITLTALSDDGGTVIVVSIPGEDLELSVQNGKWDLVLVSPDGDETPVCVGDFAVWRKVVD